MDHQEPRALTNLATALCAALIFAFVSLIYALNSTPAVENNARISMHAGILLNTERTRNHD
jgi:hypothetical protein